MKKQLWQLVKAMPAVLGTSFLVAQGAIAAPDSTTEAKTPAADQSVTPMVGMPQLATSADGLDLVRRRQQLKKFNDNNSDAGMSQVTSVSELRDVQPTEWAYEALKSLVERYGCIVGYPDRTFRGNRALSRWEFAAGLNACMNVMERLLQENVAVIREDIDKLKALAQQFEQELAALGVRVDNLESRTAFLEDHQFSTTTKLGGTTVVAVVDQFGGDKALNWRQQNALDTNQRLTGGGTSLSNRGTPQGTTPVEENFTMGYRVRLNFDTSFTGKDLLRTRLESGNIPNLNSPTGTNNARLSFDGSRENQTYINKLFYRTGIGSNMTAWVGAYGLDLDDVFNVYNPILASGDTGTLSRFNRFNPLLYRAQTGAGAAFKYNFSKNISATATYLAGGDRAGDPKNGGGLFNGEFATGAQLDWKITDSLGIGATFLHAYFRGPSSNDFPYNNNQSVNITSSTGSAVASDPFYGAPTTRDSYGLSGNWRITDTINLSATGAYASASAQGLDKNGFNRSGYGADLWTWNAGLSFLDLGKEGAVLSVAGGLIPQATNVTNRPGDPINQDLDATYLIETQYKFPVNKNILITPGVYVVLNPQGNSNNSAIWVGVLRTTFTF
ncbi:MAG: iron uptake porin [Snowella sp.]|nr:iron uptake porin [Snowella sp.]